MKIIGLEAFENYAETLMSAPERLFKLCMFQYEARAREREQRIRAEKYAEEQKRARSAITKQMQDDHEEHKRTSRELTKYKERYEKQTRDSEKLKSERDKFSGMLNRAMEAVSFLKEQVKQLKKRAEDAESARDAAVADSEMSQKEISRLQDQVSLHGKARFDSGTEKTADLFHGTGIDEDPLDEYAPSDDSHNYSAEEVIRKIGEMIGDEELIEDARSSDNKPVTGNKRGINICRDQCGYSKEELDQMFADEAEYRVYSSNKRVRLGRLRPIVYEVNEYAPKVVVRDAKGRKKYVKTLPYKNQFFRKSKCEPSLVTSVIYDKFELGLPYNRQEQEFKKAGVKVNRQDMTFWTNRFGMGAFYAVYRRMKEELWNDCDVIHMDETTWRVVDWASMNRNQKREYIRKNGSKGFVWVFSTGEFFKGNQVVIYAFDPSRSTEVLKEIVERSTDRLVYIVCDAYSAYECFEKLFPANFIRALCWMHARRKFAEAVNVLKPWLNKEILKDEVKEIPEIKGLLLANKVFKADKRLKSCSSMGRHKRRLIEAQPYVNKYFEYLHSIDLKDEKYSEKFREAVRYSLNHEKELRTFLSNGNIPIDNGKAERLVKPLARTRKNSLFSYSRRGAEVAAIIHSVIGTAKANNADVYTYLKYVMTTMPDRPKGMSDDEYYAQFTSEFLDNMMPWSKKYRDFERWHFANHIDEMLPDSDVLPEGIKDKTVA